MTSGEPAESCEASLLVPHPTRVAALVEATASGPRRLPSARLVSALRGNVIPFDDTVSLSVRPSSVSVA